MAWNTCPPKAGQAGTTSLISHVLPKFIMLLDALTNSSLGSCKSKYGGSYIKNKEETNI